MKNGFLLFLFLGFLTWQNSKAQADIYHPFPDSGAIWINANVDIPGCNTNPCNYSFYQLGKDTIIDSFKYRPILVGDSPQAFRGMLIRDDTLNKEVLIHQLGLNGPDQLYYDFNLKEGDTIPDGLYSAKINQIVVTSIDSILLDDGTYRKRFNLNCSLEGTYAQNLYLIEGIGFTGGFLTGIANDDDFEGGGFLACYSYQDTTFYNYAPLGLHSCSLSTGVGQVKKTSIKILPNPLAFGGNITVKGISENYSLMLNNVLGQTVFSQEVINVTQPITLPDSIKSGVYICRIITESNMVIIKQIVVL